MKSSIKLLLAMSIASFFNQAFADPYKITVYRNTWDYGNVTVNVENTTFDYNEGATSAGIFNGSPSRNNYATLIKPTKIWLANSEFKEMCFFDVPDGYSEIYIDLYVGDDGVKYVPTCELHGFNGTSWTKIKENIFDHRPEHRCSGGNVMMMGLAGSGSGC